MIKNTSSFGLPILLALCVAAVSNSSASAVSLPAAPAELSAAVQGKLAFWLKGDANLVTNAAGEVVAWCDAREAAVADEAAYTTRVAAGSWTYPRAIVYTSGNAPSGDVPVGADAPESFGGKPYVDFGEYNENRWLLFVDETGARKRVSITGYAGCIGFGSTAGFVVGDVNNPDVAAQSANGVGDNGSQNWHKGAGGSGDDYIYSGNNGNGRFGETRVNGRLVNSVATKHVRNGWEIFLENGPNNGGYVSTLFNNGNFKQAVSGNGDRQGGGKVAEIMLFSEMLTQSEVAEVEAYLRGRWQGGAGSADDVIALDASDTFAADAFVGPLFAGDIAGAGAIEKTGSGNFTIDRAGRLAAGPLALRGGRVTSIGKRAHFPPLLAVGGVTIGAAASTLTATTAGDADTFTLNENETGRKVALAAPEAGVAKVAATKAGLALRAPAYPAADVATAEDPDFLAIGNLITDGSFESGKLSAWTGSAFRNNNSSAAMAVQTKGVGDASAWMGNVNVDYVPDGTRFSNIQVKNGVDCTNGYSQAVTAPRAGLYRFSAWIRARKRNYSDSTVKFCLAVDDELVLVRRTGRRGDWDSDNKKFTTTETEYTFQKVSVDVALGAGSHNIHILAANTDNATDVANNRLDRALLVDDIRLEPIAPGDFVQVKDSGFDSCTTWDESEINSTNGGNLNKSSTPFWSVSGGALSRYPSTWFCNPTYADSGEDQQAALQNGATATQTISFPRAGRVRVSLRYANRSDRLDTGASRTSGQAVVVSIGGTQFDSRVVSTPDWRTLVAEGDVAAGDQALSIQSTNIGTDTSTIIDDVRIEYVGTSPRIVEDAAFAANSSTWTLGDGVAVDEDAYGLRELVFTNNVTATLSFTAPSNGTYLLSFQSRGRPLSESGTDGVYHNYRFYSHNLNVRVDGAYFANYYNEAADIHPVEIRLPYLAAGAHTLTFAGSCEALVRETAQSRISDVTVTPLATGTMADWSGVEFDLADDATIAADLGGTVRLGKLRVDGRAQYGSFTASNCDFVTGAGTVEVVPAAFVMVVR